MVEHHSILPECAATHERLMKSVEKIEEKLDTIAEDIKGLHKVIYGNGMTDKSLVTKINVLWYAWILLTSIIIGSLAGTGALKLVGQLL